MPRAGARREEAARCPCADAAAAAAASATDETNARLRRDRPGDSDPEWRQCAADVEFVAAASRVRSNAGNARFESVGAFAQRIHIVEEGLHFRRRDEIAAFLAQEFGGVLRQRLRGLARVRERTAQCARQRDADDIAE